MTARKALAALIVAGALAVPAGAAAHPIDQPLPHLVIQCPIVHSAANRCEEFVIAADPARGELGEATARVPFLVVTCVLAHGEAQFCTRSVTPVGDQVIAP